MRILITGAGGFVGRHTCRDLLTHGHAIQAMDLTGPSAASTITDWTVCDLRDSKATDNAIRTIRPEACIHLAGFSHVPAGWSKPKELFEANVIGTINLLEAFRNHAPAARLLIVTTAQVYGTQSGPAALSEADPLLPVSLYAVSKVAVDQMTLLYARHYGMATMTVRPNNHIGPGQPPDFVVSSLARQVRAIAAGAEPVIRVGNLESQRDFTDVRDVARAYRLLIEKGRSGSAYNLGSGHLVSIDEILGHLCRLANVKPEVIRDDQLFRERDSSPILDTSKLRTDTNWRPEIDLQSSLRDILAEQA
ncbi:MAG: GDP-mannose 4,6-dehydratase [bacterium]